MSSALGLAWRLSRREIGTHRLRSLLTVLLVGRRASRTAASVETEGEVAHR